MNQITSIRGMPDLLPDTAEAHTYIQNTAQKLAESFGFREIKTPILEPIEVFKRSAGETSDIVSKEMYAFHDRNGKEVCLRPEATASVVRATLNAGLLHTLPQKFFYAGPMFRYERPQKGRLRQFGQIGVEYIGSHSPFADLETILLGWRTLKSLTRDPLTLEINSLGDRTCRENYRTALVSYLSDHKNHLSHESLIRLEKNPLRILDSKDPKDQEILTQAPILMDFLSGDSQSFHHQILQGLQALGVPYTQNPMLVRGLDYYQETAFEFKVPSLGAQNTVLAGGRYDNLSALLGGPNLPSVGWAAGIDRLALILDASGLQKERPIVMVPISPDEMIPATCVADTLRKEGFSVIVPPVASLKKGLKQANKLEAPVALIMGPDEVSLNIIIVKDMASGEQINLVTDQLASHLKSKLWP